jgi:hypothetical protein
LSPQKREFPERGAEIGNAKKFDGDSDSGAKRVDHTVAKDEFDSRMMPETPEIRLTSVKKENDEEDVDPFLLDNELAILQKIIAERTVREGDIRM